MLVPVLLDPLRESPGQRNRETLQLLSRVVVHTFTSADLRDSVNAESHGMGNSELAF